MHKIIRNNRGIALFIALMLTLMLSIIGLASSNPPTTRSPSPAMSLTR